jgi:hypothetical protein
MVEELLLGDNPFTGVSHFGQEKAREEAREASLENKAMVFEAALDGGATGFTFCTHESNLKLLTYLSIHRKDLLKAMNYYILLPYVQSYVRLANVGGTPVLLREKLRSMLSNWSAIPDIVASLASSKPERLAGLLIKTEIAPYLSILPSGKVKAILLHEILTDSIMAFGLTDLLKSLNDYVQKRIGFSFGLHTKNFGCLCMQEFLARGCPEYVMTSINALGYMMAPSKEAVEKAMNRLRGKTKIIAINVLAAGAVDLDTATKYMCRFKSNIWGVTSASTKPDRAYQNFQKLRNSLCETRAPNLSGTAVGVSSKEHAHDTFTRLARMTEVSDRTASEPAKQASG